MDIVITFLASCLIWIMYLGLLLLWLVDGRIKREVAIHAFLASLVAWGVCEVVKILFPTVRPYNLNHLAYFTLTKPIDPAFPSVHTAVAFALGVSVWLHNKKLGYLFIIGAMFVGIGRILANVHYSIDVSVGSLIGIITASLVKKLHLPLDS